MLISASFLFSKWCSEKPVYDLKFLGAFVYDAGAACIIRLNRANNATYRSCTHHLPQIGIISTLPRRVWFQGCPRDAPNEHEAEIKISLYPSLFFHHSLFASLKVNWEKMTSAIQSAIITSTRPNPAARGAMIRELVDQMRVHNANPNRGICLKVANDIIQKYPICFGDVDDDGNTGGASLVQQSKTRIEHVNQNNTLAWLRKNKSSNPQADNEVSGNKAICTIMCLLAHFKEGDGIFLTADVSITCSAYT